MYPLNFDGENAYVINLDKIAKNIATLKNHLPPSCKVMGMVKAAGYGSDPIVLSKALLSSGVNILGVASVKEAEVLRKVIPHADIFVIYTGYQEAKKAVDLDLELAVSDAKLINILQTIGKQEGKTIKVHLHINTGMTRLGCEPGEAVALAKKIADSPFLKLEGVMTHFAAADTPSMDYFTYGQSSCFDQVIEEIEEAGIQIPYRHAANSAGAFRFLFPQYNMVRVGIALFGYPPFPLPENVSLYPAVSLYSSIIALTTCQPGATVSYGSTYTTKKEKEIIATLPIGYHDGLHRHYRTNRKVLINGKEALQVGTICMDFMMVETTNIPDAKIGDPVLIFGENESGGSISPLIVAEDAGTIIYELLSCIGPRIPRIFV